MDLRKQAEKQFEERIYNKSWSKKNSVKPDLPLKKKN